MLKKINVPLLAVSLVLPLLAGVLGSVATIDAIPTWYQTLNKPFFNPPSWVFSPVWTTLYILMGISLYRIWSQRGKKPNIDDMVALFMAHLVINASWSFVFFGLQLISLALVVIVVLAVMIAYLIWSFRKVDAVAAWLLVPYLLWVLFATVLNGSLLVLN